MGIRATTASGLSFRVLGSLRVIDGTADRTPAGALQRRLLGILVLHAGQTVTADSLSDVLWPVRLPADHDGALHTHVSRLRATIGDAVVQRVDRGYRLAVDPDAVDAQRFAAAVTRAAAGRATDPTGALRSLDAALEWWRGTPYEELADVDEVRIEAERLDELRLRAHEERFDCALLLGRHADVLADLDAFATEHALRERPQSQLMSTLQHAGRVADALAVYDRYRRRLGEELGIDPSPTLRQLHDDIVTGTTLARQRRRAPLPRPSSSFVGREELIDSLTAMLDQHRLVTLVGTGGAGKTRLAHEVCGRIERRYPDGVWICSLANADAASMTAAVAATLDVEQRDEQQSLTRITDVLRGQEALIVLDNCEHLLDSAAHLAEMIITSAPSVTVLATSRERLVVDGEQLCPVPPLPSPRSTSAIDEPAIRLFVDRAAAVRPEWQPTTDERAVIGTVCRHLDGLPLAIELAAARLHTLSLDEVRVGLDRRLGMLTGGRRTSDRHRSLRAAIDWSYDLLDEDERVLFDAVSVFHGPFSSTGAAAVVETDAATVMETLSALVERSLLHRRGRRYEMLETLREYGTARLADRGTLDAVCRRHARHHVAFAIACNRRLRQPGDVGVLVDLDTSLPDVRVAYRHLLEAGEIDDLLDLVAALDDYAFHRMRPEVLGWAAVVAAMATRLGIADQRVSDAYAVAGFGAWKRGELTQVDELATAARRRGTPDKALSVPVYDLLAMVSLMHGRLDDAIRWTELAIDDPAVQRDRLRWIEVCGVRLIARSYADDPDTVALADAMLELLDDSTPALSAAWIHYVIGEALVHRDHAVATVRLQRAMDLAQQAGSSFILGAAGTTYASIETRHGDPAVAMREYRWVIDLWRRNDIWALLSTTLRAVAELLVRVRRDRPAAIVLGAATSGSAHHEVFGHDLRRLGGLAQTLEQRLGAGEFEAALAEGAALDDESVAAVALAAFDDGAAASSG